MKLLHPNIITIVSSFDSGLVVGIVVCVICVICVVYVVSVVWFASALDVVVIIFSVVSIEVVSFLVREVVSIALGIVVGIIVDTSFSSLPEPSDLSTQIKPVFSVRVAKS